MRHVLAVALLALAAPVAHAAETFPNVGALIARAKADPTFGWGSGTQVIVERAVVAADGYGRGGKLPTREEFLDGVKFVNPFARTLAGDAPNAKQNLIVVQFTTERWHYDGDDALIYATSYPEVRRGYVLRLEGRFRRDNVTLYPLIRQDRVDPGLAIKGTVGEPLAPTIRDVHFADVPAAFGKTLLIRGYGFRATTRVFADGKPLEVVQVKSANVLVARVTANAPHGIARLTVADGPVAGLGSFRLPINQVPVVTGVSAPQVAPGDHLVIEGRNLTEASDMAEVGPSTFGLGLAAPDVKLGDRPLKVVSFESTAVAVVIPADATPGVLLLTVRNPAGASAPVAIVVGGSIAAPRLEKARVTGGLLLLSGKNLALTDGEKNGLRVVLSTGQVLKPQSVTGGSLVVKLPAGAPGKFGVTVAVPGRGTSNSLAVDSTIGIVGGIPNNP